MNYDPFGEDVQLDPYPIYDELRRRDTLYWNEERRFWALCTFNDVWSAVHDPATYSSAEGVFLSPETPDPDTPNSATVIPAIITMDPPRHTKMRAIVNRAFTPKRIAVMEESIRELTKSLLLPVRDLESFDLVEAVAATLPTYVIADLLGVPRSDGDDFRRWSELMVGAGEDQDRMAVAGEVMGYFTNIIAERRRQPKEDLVSILLDAEVEGESLSESELLGFCLLLLVAGNETTVNLISNTILALAEQPDQQNAVREFQPPNVVEEFLRYDSPVQALSRTLTRDVEIRGTTMRKGENALLIYGSANRDEEEFGSDAGTLNVRREMRRHLAFGHGAHHCLGASLARLEGTVACNEILATFPMIALAGEPERLRSGPMRGLRYLPVTGRG